MAGLLWYRSYMDSLANTSGYYPDIHAGHADRVAELTLDAPYLVRETPAGYNQLELMELVGGTVAWGQIISATTPIVVATNNTAVKNFQVSLTYVAGHKYLCLYTQETTLTSNTRNTLQYYDGTNYVHQIAASNHNLSAGQYWWIYSPANSTNNGNIGIWCHTPNVEATYDKYMLFDLTQMFGSTIADYVYALERETEGSGLEWLKSYGLIDDEYHAYTTPTLQSVEATSHVTKDGNGNVISTTTFGSVTLRGILKTDADGNLYYDGDEYASDGTVTRKYGYRAYQSGDASDGSTMITDGLHTVYKLNTPTTESADPFTAVQTVEDGGTEEFVTTNGVPVGNVSVYRRA